MIIVKLYIQQIIFLFIFYLIKSRRGFIAMPLCVCLSVYLSLRLCVC